MPFFLGWKLQLRSNVSGGNRFAYLIKFLLVTFSHGGSREESKEECDSWTWVIEMIHDHIIIVNKNVG